ncbi:MAG: peptide ligase PGM1-related protein [Acidobacteriota bacterium]
MNTAALQDLFQAIEAGDPAPHTSVVVPSLSFDVEELAKISGAPHYEERLLFSIMRLRDPRARVIYLTSQPLHPEIVDYYFGLLVGVSQRSIRSRFQYFCCYDATARPLTRKILERPRLIERVRGAMGDPSRAYLTCFNSTPLELSLAEKLGVPLNGCDPALLDLGSKSGGRELFREVGVPRPEGRERLEDRRAVIEALGEIHEPGLERAVIKLDESFAGAGNALFTYPDPLPEEPAARRAALGAALEDLRFTEPSTPAAFFDKLEQMGGVVEHMVKGVEVRSPSVQMRLVPNGELEIVSTHDQILGGQTGQSYAGCRFPADPAYRAEIQRHARRIGVGLRQRGVVSRFAVDFVVTRDPQGEWSTYAIEINLRMGGTTVPFLALQFLTGGHLEEESGQFLDPTGVHKFYRATDSLTSPGYRGLLPEDLMDIIDEHGLIFSPERRCGVLFHMMGALSEHGKIGVTAIGNSAAEAESFFTRTVEALDSETSQGAAERERPASLAPRMPME